jgi:hypothetical protein
LKQFPTKYRYSAMRDCLQPQGAVRRVFEKTYPWVLKV